MKNTLYIFLVNLLLLPYLVHSQGTKPDIIIMVNGAKIEAILNEIGKNDIKYRKFSNPTGPVYVLEKKEVNSILYANGETELINNVVGTRKSESGLSKPSSNESVTNKPLSEKKSKFIAKYREAESSKILSEMKSYKRRSIISKVAGTVLATGGLATILIGVLNYSSVDKKVASEWGSWSAADMRYRATINDYRFPSFDEAGVGYEWDKLVEWANLPPNQANLEAYFAERDRRFNNFDQLYKGEATEWYAKELRNKNMKIAVAGIGITGVATAVYLLGASAGWKYRLLRQEAKKKGLSIRIEPQWAPGRNYSGLRVALLF